MFICLFLALPHSSPLTLSQVSRPFAACIWLTAVTLCLSYLSLADLGTVESLCQTKPRVICMSFGREKKRGRWREKKQGNPGRHEAKGTNTQKWKKHVDRKGKEGRRRVNS